MEFEVGAKMMIEGFDRWVQGMKVWEKKTIKISPQDGYGERDPKNTQEVPKAQLEEFEKAGIKLEVWEVLPTAYGPLTIVKVTKDMVTVDMNHFLAGEYLLFEVEILEFVD
jgi:FKBP-type peptidyl-prolyl cis-trans isomerase 2